MQDFTGLVFKKGLEGAGASRFAIQTFKRDRREAPVTHSEAVRRCRPD